MPTSKLIDFISTYRGQTSYRVLSGPLKDFRVTVRPMAKSWYEDDYKTGRTYGVWRNDPEEYRLNILSSVGLVCCSSYHGQVPADIIAAVNEFEKPTRDMAPEKHCGELKGGVFVPLHGWQRAGNFVLRYGDNLHNYPSILQAEMAIARHPDIAPDEAWEEDDDCETIGELHLANINGVWKLFTDEQVSSMVEAEPEQQESAPSM